MERSPEMLFQPHQGGSHVTRNTVQAPRNNIRSPLRISGVFREIRPEDSSDLKTPFRPGKNHLESLTCFHTLAHPSRGTGAQPSAAGVVPTDAALSPGRCSRGLWAELGMGFMVGANGLWQQCPGFCPLSTGEELAIPLLKIPV